MYRSSPKMAISSSTVGFPEHIQCVTAKESNACLKRCNDFIGISEQILISASQFPVLKY